jgi:hypothetical protein
VRGFWPACSACLSLNHCAVWAWMASVSCRIQSGAKSRAIGGCWSSVRRNIEGTILGSLIRYRLCYVSGGRKSILPHSAICWISYRWHFTSTTTIYGLITHQRNCKDQSTSFLINQNRDYTNEVRIESTTPIRRSSMERQRHPE